MTPELISIQLNYSKELQPLVESAIIEVRQYFKDKIQNELTIEQVKIKSGKDKLDSAFKALNKDCALSHLLQQVANKVLGEESIHPPVSKVRERENKIDYFPLYTYCLLLKNSLDQSGKIKENNIDLINSLRFELQTEFWQLLNSDSEGTARMNLDILRNEIKEEDFEELTKIRDSLDVVQNKLVELIFNYKW